MNKNLINDKSECQYLNDLLDVGPKKPLGYLPLSTISDICNVNVDDVANYLVKKGIETRIWKEDFCRIDGGVLYAYDSDSLQKLLNQNISVLYDAGWSTHVDGFVIQVVTKLAPHYSPIFDLIADSFADYDNGWRLIKKNVVSD